MFELDWDTPFYPAYGLITMPKDLFVYYRSYDTTRDPISEMPAYYGSETNARGYVHRGRRKLAAFTNQRPLQLMDIRFMKDILRTMFSTNADDYETLSIILSFGLCSLQHQCKLAKKRFTSDEIKESVNSLCSSYNNNDFEQQGVRVAETTNDAHTMAFLKTLFAGFADGFISPKQTTSFHIEKNQILNGELIIFNPKNSGIIMLDSIPPKSDLTLQKMEWLYLREEGKKIHLGTPPLTSEFYMLTKGEFQYTTLPSVEDIAQRLDHDPIIQENWSRGEKAGRRWKDIMPLGLSINPHPKVSISNWNETPTPIRKIDIESVPTILSKLDECLSLLKSSSK